LLTDIATLFEDEEFLDAAVNFESIEDVTNVGALFNEAYANLKRGGSVVGKYRVNARGELEQYDNGSWSIVSSTYTS